MNKRIFSIYILALFLTSGCGSPFETHQNEKIMKSTMKLLQDRGGDEGINFFKLPKSMDNIPQDPNNKITEAKVELGQMLFHDPIIAVNNRDAQNVKTYSCAACHSPTAGFTSGNMQGIAEGGLGTESNRSPSQFSSFFDVQPIKVPPTLNISFQKNLLWNGELGDTELNSSTQDKWLPGTGAFFNSFGFQGPETQALAGQMVHGLFDQTTAQTEAASLNSDIFSNQTYINMFKAAFPDKANDSDLISHETVALAIAAYDRTILANQAPFQKFLDGDESSLTLDQVKGLNVFLNKGQCYKCHTGPALNSMEFHALGFNDFDPNATVIKAGEDAAFLGRGNFTKNSQDNFKFKVPQLYNVKDHFRHGHGGSFKSIREVIEYKNNARSQNPNVPGTQLAEDFIPLNLSDDEISYLVDFVENGLRDPNLQRYVPDSVPSGICFPTGSHCQ